MSSKQILQMKYHPAKKEVEFRRFKDEKEIQIRDDSKLKKYVKKKGEFVLQHYGNEFFDDIAYVFDGLDEVNIDVVTTEEDYKDFEKMVEEYNNGGLHKCKINAKLIDKLPDMDETFKKVKVFGEKAKNILEIHKNKLYEIKSNSNNVLSSIDAFSRHINDEIKNINEKIENLNDNCISLCFVGVYSSGKSALINAILGYKILPENISSETSKIVQISSPKKDEKIKIIFRLYGFLTELAWNEASNKFEYTKGGDKNDINEELQKEINELEKKKKYKQIYSILYFLNQKEAISNKIEVYFPIPLDNEKIQFKIYDTPGSDSNVEVHQEILKEALSNQTQSILIFVVKPDGLEGTGNNTLLNYIKDAVETSTKTTIDIDRSLFVINKGETIDHEARNDLHKKEIKNKEDKNFSIRLSDKKLFFTSALYGYASKAITNGVYNKTDEYIFEHNNLDDESNPCGMLFKENRCATSESGTKNMIEESEKELKNAKDSEDKAKLLLISSGLYALEREILKYGEKFAVSVKTFAIINSVENAINKITNKANSLKNLNLENINENKKSMEELKNCINNCLNDEYNKRKILNEDKIPTDILRGLKLDSDTLKDCIVGNIKSRIGKILKTNIFNQTKVNNKDKEKINNVVSEVIDNYTKDFINKRKEILENQRDGFMLAVKNVIVNNGNICDSAKKYFLNIPKPNVRIINEKDNINLIYDANTYTKKFLFIKNKFIKKEQFIQTIEEEILNLTKELADDYKKDYINSLDTLLTQIKENYILNLEEYSVLLKALNSDRDAMLKLEEKLNDMADALDNNKNELNNVIWEVRK